MNDIHDIEDVIKIVNTDNNLLLYAFFVLVFLLFLSLLVIYFLKKIKSQKSSIDYISLLKKRLNNLSLNDDFEKALDEITFILKEYIYYKEDINCFYLTTEEISKIILDNQIINILQEIDYIKYSSVKVKDSDIKNLVQKLKFIIKK
jgi:hypothetical protein